MKKEANSVFTNTAILQQLHPSQILNPQEQKSIKGGNDGEGDDSDIIYEEIVDH